MSPADAPRSPIRIDCEGSGTPTHRADHHVGMCKMCGELVPVTWDGTAVHHHRNDIIAMIDRGDFG